MFKSIRRFMSQIFFPFQSEWNWYKDECWYWPDSRSFMPYLHPRLNVEIDSVETHNWVERVLHGSGGRDQGVTDKIRRYTAIAREPVDMDAHEKAFLAAVEYSLTHNSERWPYYTTVSLEQQLAIAEGERQMSNAFWDLDYVITGQLNSQERRLKDNENVELVNEFLKRR
jgi:hypothetical protein